jgi:uncharacterized RDD family membrane protein YckC
MEKKTNSLALKIGAFCLAGWVIFLILVIGEERINYEPGLSLLLTITAFLLPWLMTHLGARIIDKSLGALRLGIRVAAACGRQR